MNNRNIIGKLRFVLFVSLSYLLINCFIFASPLAHSQILATQSLEHLSISLSNIVQTLEQKQRSRAKPNPETFIKIWECEENGKCAILYSPDLPDTENKSSFYIDRRSTIRIEPLTRKIVEVNFSGELSISAKILSPTSALLPVTNYLKADEGSKSFKQSSFVIQGGEDVISLGQIEKFSKALIDFSVKANYIKERLSNMQADKIDSFLMQELPQLNAQKDTVEREFSNFNSLTNSYLALPYLVDLSKKDNNIKIIYELIKKKQTDLESLINQIKQLNLTTDRDIDLYASKLSSISNLVIDTINSNDTLKEKITNYQAKSADIIPPGEINLAQAKIQAGSIIQILISNKVSFNSEDVTLEKQFTFKTNTYNFDWSISPSVNFIKRIKDPKLSDPTLDLTASNFKPAPGVNLRFRLNFRNETANFFIPSIIVNSSLLDFVASDNLEVGIGIGIGWLNDLLSVGYGQNMNSSGNHRGYFFLGIDFIQSVETFKPIFTGR